MMKPIGIALVVLGAGWWGLGANAAGPATQPAIQGLAVGLALAASLLAEGPKASPSPATRPAEVHSATALPPPPSRYVFLPPIDDEGKTSGSHAVTICLPAGYESTDRRYPVFYLLDGEAAFLTAQHDMRDTTAYELAHDQLVHEGLIQPAILVAVHNSFDANGEPVPGNRGTDYNPYHRPAANGKGSAEGYYEFLSQKIKPMIDRTYRTRPEPASTGVAGFSAGGAGAFWMTYLHPETFGMALCQSGFSSRIIDEHQGPIPAVRLWIDVGSREIGKGPWKPAYDLSRKLVALGFRQNDNLAFYTGHNQGHEKFDCNKRLRSALYFLLRTKTPQLTGVEICETDTLFDGPIRLGRTGHAILEPAYDNWFRLTDCTAQFTVADPAVAVFDGNTNELRPQAEGRTTITSSFAGRPVVQQVEVPALEPPLPCWATTRPIVLDGNLSDWPELPYKVDAPLSTDDAPAWRGPADLSYRFACAHDDRFLYIAIETHDDCLKSEPNIDPWFQDGIEVRIDARPAAQRLLSRGENEGSDFLLVATSPAKEGETRLPYNSDKLPEGTKVVCKATATGHNTEIAIPFAYLNDKAGKEWTDVRVNIMVDDLDNDYKGYKGGHFWWKPDWRGAGNIRGSGTFERQPASR